VDLLHLVDKPEGWTSHDVVARLRRVLGERRVGHAGTLDPFATGLLLVAEGRATALLGCMSLLPKRYHAVARLGVATATQDRTGQPVSTVSVLPSEADVHEALDRLRRSTFQRPPSYSAVKVRGERMYKAARRGETLEAAERPIRIYELHANTARLPDVAMDVTVSRGTYVRTLAHDLGQALGCGAHLISLRRVATGPFQVEDATALKEASCMDAAELRTRALGPADAVPHLPRVSLTEDESAKLRHGRAPVVATRRVKEAPLRVPIPPGEAEWPLALLSHEGELLALAAAPVPSEPLRLLRVFP
jgi:tRNA pseudouridine55 synthase